MRHSSDTQLLITLPPLFYLSIAFICDVIALYWWSRVFGCIDLYKARASSWVVWTRLWQDKVARLMSSLLRYRKHLKYFRPSFPLSPPVKRVPLAACHTASLFKNPQLYASQLRSENDVRVTITKENFEQLQNVSCGSVYDVKYALVVSNAKLCNRDFRSRCRKSRWHAVYDNCACIWLAGFLSITIWILVLVILS